MKTSKKIREWLNELPQEIKEKALANTSSAVADTDEPSLSEAIAASFSWGNSPEGHDYWSDIYKSLEKEQSKKIFVEYDIYLLRLLRSEISLDSNTGLCNKSKNVSDNNLDIQRLQDILAENKPKGKFLVHYWWPLNPYGNIMRWLFVTKLIWKLKFKGGLK
jgi:hypothetical protein